MSKKKGTICFAARVHALYISQRTVRTGRVPLFGHKDTCTTRLYSCQEPTNQTVLARVLVWIHYIDPVKGGERVTCQGS